jgi:hypothetical protein
METQNEALRGRDDTIDCSSIALLCGKTTRLRPCWDFLLALDRPILSRSLTTTLALPLGGSQAGTIIIPLPLDPQ